MKRVKYTTAKRICNYQGHVIYFDTETKAYLVALKKDGTDSHFSTLDEAYNAIDALNK